MKTNTYLALDLEMYWDEHLYEAHRTMDPKSNRRATAVKRVMAASVFEFSVDSEGRVATGEVASWTEHDWGDEQAVVAQLFDYLRARADTPVLTFGGLATDVPVLVLASMAHGLPLPPQLIDQPGRKGPRPHLDLALLLKGGGRTWSHLSQVLLRLTDTRIQALARKVIHAMKRMPATGIFGDDYPFKSVWDEYCREVQEGPNPMLEAAFDQTVDPMIAWQVDQLDHSERHLLEIALAEAVNEQHHVRAAIVPLLNDRKLVHRQPVVLIEAAKACLTHPSLGSPERRSRRTM
ncbi:hypothetical protein PF049_03855 [Erythrobacteraceae bacterium WH01K]|nr:hypothetical protein PF049_03855 [Erythrobacteraceae bacterium WH01K]